MLRVAFVKDMPGDALDDPEFVKTPLTPQNLEGKVYEPVPRPLNTRGQQRLLRPQ
jgi:hypothetical protein